MQKKGRSRILAYGAKSFLAILLYAAYYYDNPQSRQLIREPELQRILKQQGADLSLEIKAAQNLGANSKIVHVTRGFIYLIRNKNTGNLKIGFSSTPKTRLQALQTATDCELELIKTIPGTMQKEQELHRKFADFRVRNEWFYPALPLLTYFDLQPTTVNTSGEVV